MKLSDFIPKLDGFVWIIGGFVAALTALVLGAIYIALKVIL